MKQVYLLSGLCCPNCADKIEKEVNKIHRLISASLDFASTTLSIEISSPEYVFEVEEEIKKIILRIEPHVKLIDQTLGDENEKHHHNYLTEIRVGDWLRLSGAVIFGISFLNFFSEEAVYLKLIAYFLIGYHVIWRCVIGLKHRDFFDENFLMTIATSGALYIREFNEAVVVMLFYQIGEFLQGLAVNNSRRSIMNLLTLKVETTTVLREKKEITVDPEEVFVDEIILVRPGERVALDSIVEDGESFLDMSALSGESVPVRVKKGDEVWAGSINKNSILELKVVRKYADSAVAKILNKLQHAAQNKAKTEKFITKFSRIYTPIVVSLAILIAILPPLLIEGAIFNDWLYRAMIFLVISCPCALVLSIPLGFFGGIGALAKQGVLIKGGNYLEVLADVKCAIFDKTGTLTKGVFEVVKAEPFNGFSREELLKFAVMGELGSSHPIAVSIKKSSNEVFDRDQISFFEEVSGSGTITEYNKHRIICGNSAFFEQKQIDFTSTNEVGTIVYVAVDEQYAGFIVIRDEIKDDALQTISQLKARGIETVMITGDNPVIAQKISSELKIDRFFAGLLPWEKVEQLERIEQEKRTGKVLFMGDGLNDALILSRADIGVAMGGLGSDAAIEASDVVIMNDEPHKIISAIDTARFTKKIVWQNIYMSFGVKFVVMFLGVFGLASMWEAVFADVGVALFAVANAIRIIRRSSEL